MIYLMLTFGLVYLVFEISLQILSSLIIDGITGFLKYNLFYFLLFSQIF